MASTLLNSGQPLLLCSTFPSRRCESLNSSRSFVAGGRPCSKSVLLGNSLISRQSRPSKRTSELRKAKIVAAAETEVSGSGGGFIGQFTDFFQGILKNINQGQKTETGGSVSDEMGTGKKFLVAGSTGRVGKIVVKKLLAKGHTVIALVASDERAEKVLLEEEGLKLGPNPRGAQLLTAVGDVADDASLRSALDGCDAVICAVGSRFSPGGYQPGNSPEEIYGKGIPALIRAARDVLPGTQKYAKREELKIFDFSSLTPSVSGDVAPLPDLTNGTATSGDDGKPKSKPTPVDGWFVLDDVIMGGISDGGLKKGEGAAIFEGTLRSEGGGFSSIRSLIPKSPLDLSTYDGLTLRLKGDGQRYKLGTRPEPEFKGPAYVAMFDTVKDEWTTVSVPFDQFRPVDRSSVLPDAPPLDKNSIHSIQILATLFQLDKQMNPLSTPGAFRLEVASIGAYRNPRPQFVLVSSAAVERSARATSVEAREASIPIVKLNPGGVLTYKLFAEDTLRASGMPYAIVRPCGLTDKDLDQPFLLEVAQGDALTGLISREEVATVCAETAESPDATWTTFEVRRDDLSKGLAMSDFLGLFRRLRPDVRSGFVTIPPPLADKDSEAEAPAPPSKITT